MVLRITTAFISAAVLIVTVVVAPPTPTASAAEVKTAIFGTVAALPKRDRIDIATRSGVISLKIEEATIIRGRTGELKFSLVDLGMTVAGYYVEKKKGPVAVTLTFVNRTQIRIFEHVVGVIIERNRSTITVRTFTGELVVIELAGDGSDQTEVGSLIATVVERDATTGELTSTALQTAQETVKRLSESIDYEISLAQRELLKIRMSEMATVHMTRLHETLSEINVDTQARIRAAYTEFQASYEATMKEVASDSITVQMTGTVLSVFASELHVESLTDGTRWSFGVTDSTVVELSGGAAGTIADIVAGQTVEVDAIPISPVDWPIANVIRVVPDDVPAPTPVPTDDTITGTIVLVDSGTVVVVVLDDGTDGAAGLNEDTVVIVDGEQLSVDELEAGQEVQIILADDGFSAQEVTATAPVAAPEYTLIGILRSINEFGVVLDGVQLTLDNFATTWDASTIGQQVELRFYVDDEGRLVVTGTK
ncbi:MAG: hypothetical protein J4N96_09790 [Chloroflexi bacterium]|nr:hypothetical protein [Chloroflexota bacterium]